MNSKNSKLFSPKQIEVIRYDNKNSPVITICEGAVRSGKTTVLLWLFINHIHQFKNQKKKFIITGYTIGTVKKNVLDEMTAIFGIDTTLNQQNEFQLFGNKIVCFGTDKADSYKAIKGLTAYGWLGNEMTEQHKTAVDQCFKRISGLGARVFWDTNPSYPKHQIKTEYIDRSGEKLSDGRIWLKSWHFIMDDNIFLSEEYKESLKKSIPKGHLYDRDVLGLWVSAEGMIYKDFNPDIHVIDIDSTVINRIKEVFLGVDWGFEHHGVINVIGRDDDGAFYLLEEIAEREKTIDWWIEIKNRVIGRYYRQWTGLSFCDSARPEYVMQFGGLEAKKEVVEGISFVSSLFSKNRIFISRNAKRILSEIYEYQWNEKALKEEPVKNNDDSLDALRYGVYSYYLKTVNQISFTGGRRMQSDNILRGF
ncbi:MAG TPA: PBSX family phage terminase large subunit [Spirochaetia bacterium]|nr:MAG: hypothetical protein A2Y41_07240 [Spirochaetes bacterium GWB1_36_13]HCL55458.1 PBSX family phage terminase large subunit [Spirochaetia bacterium]